MACEQLPPAPEIDQRSPYIGADLLLIFQKGRSGDSVRVAVFPRRLLAVAPVHKFGHCLVDRVSLVWQVDVIFDVAVIEADFSVLNPGGESGGAVPGRQVEGPVVKGNPAGHVPERPDMENDEIFRKLGLCRGEVSAKKLENGIKAENAQGPLRVLGGGSFAAWRKQSTPGISGAVISAG